MTRSLGRGGDRASLAIFLLYRVIPLGWNVVLSFQSWSPMRPPRWVGFEHYEEMLFYDDIFWTALWNTMIWIGAAPVAILLALTLLARRLTGVAERGAFERGPTRERRARALRLPWLRSAPLLR